MGGYGAHRSAQDSASRAGRLRARVDRFLSLTRIEIGPRIDPAGVRGYPIDFRSERDDPAVLRRFVERPGHYLWGLNAERGLACYERWLEGDGEQWLDGARAAADVLVQYQTPSGAWLQVEPFWHTFVLEPPWASALAQGQAASLLVRVFLETREDRYAEAALRALDPFAVPTSEGGVSALLGTPSSSATATHGSFAVGECRVTSRLPAWTSEIRVAGFAYFVAVIKTILSTHDRPPAPGT